MPGYRDRIICTMDYRNLSHLKESDIVDHFKAISPNELENGTVDGKEIKIERNEFLNVKPPPRDFSTYKLEVNSDENRGTLV